MMLKSNPTEDTCGRYKLQIHFPVGLDFFFNQIV